MSVDFTPSRGEYTELKPFRYWCQKVLPLVYDDSLSYYELLSKILDSLNKAMEDVETLNDDVTALYTAYTALQDWITDYVENFFEGEGVQNAVNAKIDAMVVSGVFGTIVNDKVASQINAVVASQLGTVVQGQLPSVVQTQIPGVVSSQLPGVVNNQIGDIVDTWLNANITPDTTLLDRTINATNKAPSAYDMKNMLQAMKNNYSFIDKYTMFDYPGDISTGRNDLAVMEYMTRTWEETVSNKTVFIQIVKKGNSLNWYNANNNEVHCYPSLIPITRNLLPPLSSDFATVSQTMPTIPNVATSYNKNAILNYFVNLKSNNTIKIAVDISVTVTGSETPVVCLTGWKLVKIYVSNNNIVTQNLADFVITGSVADGKIHAECEYTFGDINRETYEDPATVGFGLAILTGDTSVELTTYQETGFEEGVTYSDNTNFFPKGSGFNITITGDVVDTDVDDLKAEITLISNGVATFPKMTAKNMFETIPNRLCGVYVGSTLSNSLSESIDAYVLIVPCDNINTISYPLFITTYYFGTAFYDENDICISGYYNSTEQAGTIHTLNVPKNAVKCAISIPSRMDAMEWDISMTANSIDGLTNSFNELAKKQNETDLTLKYLLNTECEYKYFNNGDWGEELTDYAQKAFITTNALGQSVSNVSTASVGTLRNYKIDVSNYKKVAFPAYKSTSGWGELFADENDIVCGVYTNPTYDSGTMVVVDVPENSKYLYLSRNINWNQDICFLIGAINTLENTGGGSSIIIIHDDSYPSLTDTEKQEMVTLCNGYYTNRSKFLYGGAYRNQYVNSSCISNGKFLINCGNFAQFIWMGRSASDFDPNNYTPYINKAFDWGYYFDFLVHRKCYGIYKNQSASTDAGKYYGYQNPTGSNPYSFNTYDNGSGMQFRPFMAAADLAFELFMLGCEVPRRAVEVGDMIFYRGPEYSGMTNETQLNFRNISHVGICIDNDYNNLGILRVMESTFYDPNGDISIISLDETDVNNRVRAGMYENRIVMCARHPHAFGIPTNVPNAITAI